MDYLDPGSQARDQVAAAVAPAPAASVLDNEVLDGLRELGDPEFLAELVGDYLESMGPYLASLDAAAAAGDSDTLYKTAHTMKSSSANMGATQLAEMCKELETMGRCGDLAGVLEKVAALRSQYVLVEAALTAELD